MAQLDIFVLIFYFILIMTVSYFSGRGSKKAEDFFLAGRSMPFWPVALSVVATMVGGTTLISAPGWAYNSGLFAFMINVNIPLAMLISSIVFIPFLYNLNITSIYEYIGIRFGAVSQILVTLAFFWTCLSIAGAWLIAPTLVLHTITGWHQMIIIALLLVLVIIYTMAGGLKAVIATDSIQMVVIWVSVIAVISIVLKTMNVGLLDSFKDAIEAGKFKALDFTPSLAVDSGMWVSVFGFVFLHLQYYAADQSQLQRLLSTKDLKNMRKSLNLGGCVYNIQMMVFMLIGLMLFGYYKGMAFESDNDLFIKFIVENMPPGLFGLVIAAIIAGTMGGVDSLLNSMSTVFMKDIYEPITGKKNLNVKFARVLVLIFGVGMGFFTFFGYSGTTTSLIAVLGMLASYVGGPMLGMFISGMFFKKIGEKSNIAGFVSGILVSLVLSNFLYEHINWGWVTLGGLLVSVGVSVLCGHILLNEKSKAITSPELTFFGQRKKIIAEDKIWINGICVLPGKVVKSSYILLAFFLFQFIVLGWFMTL